MLKPRMLWTKKDDEWLALNYYSCSKKELMKKLKRSYGSITHRAYLLKMKGKLR